MGENGLLEKKEFEKYYTNLDFKPYLEMFSTGFVNYEGVKFDKVLDIGAGYGNFIDALKPFNFDCYGLEGSQAGVDFNIKNNNNVKLFMLENNKALPFKDSQFSLIFFNQVIEHLDKETGMFIIQEINRILEVGGVAIINSPSRYNRIWNTDPNHIYCWKPKELRDYAQTVCGNSKVIMIRTLLEFWHLIKYNEKVIDSWHINGKFKFIRYPGLVISKILDVILSQFDIDYMLGGSSVIIVKRD